MYDYALKASCTGFKSAKHLNCCQSINQSFINQLEHGQSTTEYKCGLDNYRRKSESSVKSRIQYDAGV